MQVGAVVKPGTLVVDSNSKPVVLLIDDSADVHRLVRTRLRYEAIELVTAFSGVEGIAIAREKQPWTILLDLDMPEMDGFSVLRELKAASDTTSIAVIVLSGISESQDKVTAFDLGAIDYVTKPFDFAELRARLRSSLRMQRLMKMLAERAEVDGLTGLGNRPQFDRRLRQELSENARYGHPLSLALMDLDHFKSINDTYGHPAGDEVLQEFAKIVLGSIRSTDIACRYGGEEFALIMPNTGPDDARAVCDRIRASVAAVKWARHPERPITVSMGLSGLAGPGPGLTAEAFIEGSDRALYTAKRSGRNQVVVGNPATPGGSTPPLAKAG